LDLLQTNVSKKTTSTPSVSPWPSTPPAKVQGRQAQAPGENLLARHFTTYKRLKT